MLRQLLFVFLAFTLGTSALAQTRPFDPPADMRLISTRMPSFMVKVYSADPENPALMGSGSGELVKNSDGVVRIITNQHVVGKAQKVYVQFDGQPKAQLVSVLGKDPAIDLALLEAPPLPAGVTHIEFAKSISIGDRVYAVGYPSGNRTITGGEVGSLSTRLEDIGIGVYFMHTAPIAPGSSGGALVRIVSTASGNRLELVGINTRVGATATHIVSIGMSIRADVVERMIPKLESGQASRAFLGVLLVDTSRANPYEFSRAYDQLPDGVIVRFVLPNFPGHPNPALRSGIAPGDRITKFEISQDGSWVDIMRGASATQLRDLVFFDVAPDTEVRATTVRGGTRHVRSWRLGEYTEALLKALEK